MTGFLRVKFLTTFWRRLDRARHIRQRSAMSARRTLPRVGMSLVISAALALLLVAQSGAYSTTHSVRPHALLPRIATADRTSMWSSRINRAGQLDVQSTPAAAASSLARTSSRGRLFRAITKLRGGSPATNVPDYDAAADAIAGISMPAVALTGGPALFAQGVLLSMIMSLDGFRVREHFVSYGYGFSVALQAAGAAWLFRDGIHMLSALHVAGIVAYGLRLVLFCRWRDTLPCFQNRRKRLSQPKAGGRPYTFWGICSMLYGLLALPTVYALRRLPAPEGLVGVSQAGLAVMAIGLLVEGVADFQKSQFKKRTPDGFCGSGLYRFSRHPNYFGEAVFWSGVWLAATPSYVKWYHWVFATLGPTQIISIILRATGGLEKRQADKYGSSKAWKAYTTSTPVLIPFTRQYTWGKTKANKA